MNVDQQLRDICFDLNIKFDISDFQDWGIIHSNSKRVEDFINYYVKFELNELMQYYVFELIVASYNDAMLENLITDNLKLTFLDVINRSKSNVKLNIIKDYWRKIYTEEEFPVGKLLPAQSPPNQASTLDC